MPGLLLALTLLAGGQGEPPRVLLLPLRPGPDVTAKQAAGIDALLRQAIEGKGYVTLLSRKPGDKKRARSCASDAVCLHDLALARTARWVASGLVSPTQDGFAVEMVVVGEDAPKIVRKVTAEVLVDPTKTDREMQYLARATLAPETLLGGISIRGEPPGADVFVDGKHAGTLPLDDVVAVPEGDHVVEVRASGFAPLSRPVTVRFRDVTDVEVVLSKTPGRLERAEAQADESWAGQVNTWGPLTLAAVGVALFASGAVAGAFMVLDLLEVQKRAETQSLEFPRDELLWRRGQALAVIADVLFGLGLLTASSAGAWWLTAWLLAPEPVVLEELPARPRGAPPLEKRRGAPKALQIEDPTSDDAAGPRSPDDAPDGDTDDDTVGDDEAMPEGDD